MDFMFDWISPMGDIHHVGFVHHNNHNKHARTQSFNGSLVISTVQLLLLQWFRVRKSHNTVITITYDEFVVSTDQLKNNYRFEWSRVIKSSTWIDDFSGASQQIGSNRSGPEQSREKSKVLKNYSKEYLDALKVFNAYVVLLDRLWICPREVRNRCCRLSRWRESLSRSSWRLLAGNLGRPVRHTTAVEG